jgi:uncharacterized protein YqeY
MSELKVKLKSDMKEAMKNKENFKRDTIRFLMNSVKQIEVDERRELSDEDMLKVIRKNLKQREDAIAQYQEAGRDDLVEKEEREASLLKAYLPAQLDDNELQTVIKDIITKTGASSMKDIGKVMGMALKATDGRADGKRINEVVKNLLSS